LEARRPGSSAHAARDHVQHLDAIAMLEVQARRVETAQGAARMVAAGELYRVLALFVAENFEHMHVEETKNNPALWAAYSDAELIEIPEALIASIPTAEMNEVLRIMVPNVTPFERAVMLGEMQSKAPAAVFSGVLELVRPALSARDWDKLMFALAPLPIAA
jgi:hypothetical protein